MKSTTPTINSIEKTCDIMLALGNSQAGLGVTELSNSLGLSKSNVSKILSTLAKKNFVMKKENNKYTLSLLMYVLSSKSYDNSSYATIKLNMKKLFSKFNETIHLGVIIDKDLFIIDKFNGTQPISITSHAGSFSPLLATSVGKAIVAFLDDDRQMAILHDYKFKAYTPNTITNIADMEKELKKIKHNGYAFDNEEKDQFVKCLGVPIIEPLTKSIIGGVSISVPSFRLTDSYKQQIITSLKATDFFDSDV